MAQWRVWNRHPHGLTHKEKFRDEMIEIKAGQYVLMDYEDAVQFRGQYFPMKKKPTGEDDPAGFKVIHLEKHDDSEVVETAKEYICHFDGKKFSSQALLDAYVNQNYSEHVFKDDALDEAIEKEQKAKRGPGRPPKEKSA